MTNLSAIQKKYKGMWVAFTDDLNSVIAASRDVKIAYKKALEKGYRKPTLFKVPLHIVPYVGVV
ncbi:hypothetical protein A3F29_02825 [Candidatus Roizmanbacteria bacterium RIFCSPHIGHO2_12_FULL_33_9]|uniref:DUF5678 domain-containing protein n=1 Tax=Candidatus Roizmanbacteria bacterium RIFCSPHIGHO2_12_FULL_33_9 TaxID=1802045 RepID=A0A1F7HJE2_9BACT|nr:MAG: hypothetical protein A3F29_02825 [Candidatus Roizmanbacteria bacterium RIFCSPHIGHO2_12_FULL_33_9]